MRLAAVSRIAVPKLLLLYAFAGTLTFLAVVSSGHMQRPKPLPPYYAYGASRASNGLQLHAIRTQPAHIGLKAVNGNLAALPDYGINGGFFWQGYLLSIAVVNDRPVKGEPGEYGSGWFNTDRKKGTLVWDGAARRFSVQVVEDAKDLSVTDRANYWAQGGVSMSLRDDAGWARQAAAEDMPKMAEPRMRSGMVYDTGGLVWLFVSPEPCTVEQFRSAVKEWVGPQRAVDGIFLDGDGSSQLHLAQISLPGDRREVYQMIRLVP